MISARKEDAMDARRSHMVVLRGVGVLLVLLLGSVLALVQPASAAPALIATESPRPPDNVQADHTGMIDDDPHPPDSTPSPLSARRKCPTHAPPFVRRELLNTALLEAYLNPFFSHILGSLVGPTKVARFS